MYKFKILIQKIDCDYLETEESKIVLVTIIDNSKEDAQNTVIKILDNADIIMSKSVEYENTLKEAKEFQNNLMEDYKIAVFLYTSLQCINIRKVSGSNLYSLIAIANLIQNQAEFTLLDNEFDFIYNLEV